MKSVSSPFARALTLCAFVAIISAGTQAFAQEYPDLSKRQDAGQSKDKTAPVSDAERQAIQKVNTAPDAAAKIQAASEFVKKYPKSPRRAGVLQHVAAEIAKTADSAQQITLAESFMKTFSDPGDTEIIAPLLMDAYVKAKRIDDAFQIASKVIEKNPNDVALLTQMALVGTEEIKHNNPKFLQQTQQYGLKAIELIEADKKPDQMEAAQWSDYKAAWLPALYQSAGIISLVTGNRDDAKTRLDKAASLNSSDPVTFMLLGSLVNDEYQQLAEQHKAMMAGPAQDEVLKKAKEKMDQVIEFYARTVALTQTDPRYEKLQEQVMQDLEAYYKYRHNGSAEGLQQFIDKYKKQ